MKRADAERFNFIQKLNGMFYDRLLGTFIIIMKVFSAETTKQVEDWLNDQLDVIYDSIKLQCHSVDNSPSGVIFTIVVNCA